MIVNPHRDDTGVYTWLEDDKPMTAPSVSLILRPIQNFAGVPQNVLEYASARGTAVHKACELYDNDELDMDSLHDEIHPYLLAWMKFITESKWKTMLGECFVRTNGRIRVAGTMDRFGTIQDNHKRVPAVLDIKTGEIPRSAGPQTFAYRLAAADTHEIASSPGTRRLVVQLKPDGTYYWTWLNDPHDEQIFNSLYNIYTWNLGGWKR